MHSRINFQQLVFQGKSVGVMWENMAIHKLLTKLVPLLCLDYIQCPYCSRRFNEAAAGRHINFCKEQSTRRTFSPSTKAAKPALVSKCICPCVFLQMNLPNSGLRCREGCPNSINCLKPQGSRWIYHFPWWIYKFPIELKNRGLEGASWPIKSSLLCLQAIIYLKNSPNCHFQPTNLTTTNCTQHTKNPL